MRQSCSYDFKWYFDARPILQLSVIALCVVSQRLNRKITKYGSACKLTFEVNILRTFFMKINDVFC